MAKRGVKPKAKPEVKSLNPSRPECPKEYDATTRIAWNSLCDDLEQQGTIHKTDRKLIEVYAKTYTLWDRCFQQLLTAPLTLTSDNGREFINPLANLYNNLSQKLHRILLDCGLSPTTRKVSDLPTDTREANDDPI